jgi:uncharacterized lipoprotein
MGKKMKKIIFILLAFLAVSACSTVGRMFPETRDEYQRAQTLPDLEIPPDLTAGTINNSMSIPGEGSVRPQPPVTNVAPQPVPQNTGPRGMAQIQVINNSKSLLSIPAEFTVAWIEVERTLEGAGLVIDAKDPNKGTFNVTSNEKWGSRSLFSMLSGKGNSYVITLTGVGDKTELVVLDEDGEWVESEESDRLLSSIQTQYNISRTN